MGAKSDGGTVMSGPLTQTDPPVSRWRRFCHWAMRFWRWLLDVLRGPEVMPEPVLPPASPPPPQGRLSERRDLTSPLVVPASGYIFNFNVHAAFVWTSNGLPRELLSGLVQHFMPYAARELKALAAGRARHYPPHRARELEVHLQELLAEKGSWRYTLDGAEVTCRPHAWVQLDERVKQAVQPYWEQLIKLDCEHDVQMKRAEYAEQLSKQWMSILTDLVGSPLADGAAQLTEKELAVVVEKIIAERKAAAAKLDGLLEEKIREGDAFDKVEHFEMLKERLERQAAYTFAAHNVASVHNSSANGKQP